MSRVCPNRCGRRYNRNGHGTAQIWSDGETLDKMKKARKVSREMPKNFNYCPICGSIIIEIQDVDPAAIAAAENIYIN